MVSSECQSYQGSNVVSARKSNTAMCRMLLHLYEKVGKSYCMILCHIFCNNVHVGTYYDL